MLIRGIKVPRLKVILATGWTSKPNEEYSSKKSTTDEGQRFFRMLPSFYGPEYSPLIMIFKMVGKVNLCQSAAPV